MERVDLRSDGIPIDDIRSRDLPWQVLIAELVDNAFDADAKRTNVIIGKRSFTISDDGVGVADTKALLVYGRHDPHGGTRAGRYGVGAKLALYRGDLITLRTVRSGFEHKVTLHVPSLRRNASDVAWPGKFPTSDQAGTSITVEKIPAMFSELRLRDIRPYLAKTYAPGIRQGRQILIGSDPKRLEPLQPWEPPILTDVIEVAHDFGDGRRFRCRAGILKDPHAEGRGTYLAYHFRRLDETTVGLEDAPGARIHVAITLEEDRYRAWHLDTNKRKLSEVHTDELSTILAPSLAPLIDRERNQRRHLKVEGANRLLELAMDTADGRGTRTPRPGPGSEEGGLWGRGRGEPPEAPHPETAPLPKRRTHTRRPGPPKGLIVVPDRLPESEAFRYVESTRIAAIHLNTDHLLWQQIGDNEQAICRMALLIYEYNQALTKLRPQRGLPLGNQDERDQIGLSFGAKLATLVLATPKAVLAVPKRNASSGG